MSKLVHIVDYGAGNLYSARRAVEKVGGEACLSNDPAEIASAERLLLPGVGAFASCATALRSGGLSDPIAAFAATGRPFMGICVGMQLLFDYSLEFGRHEGLGLIAGHAEHIPAIDASGTRKVPHVGWSELRVPAADGDWRGTVLEDAAPGKAAAYFVHSYNCVPDDPSCLLAEADYDGFAITAAVMRDNIIGCQFHPEKSADVGLRLLERFLAI